MREEQDRRDAEAETTPDVTASTPQNTVATEEQDETDAHATNTSVTATYSTTPFNFTNYEGPTNYGGFHGSYANPQRGHHHYGSGYGSGGYRGGGYRGGGYRGGAYRGGGQRGGHYHGRGYHSGTYYGRGGRAGYSPYAGQPSFKNRSAVFNNADSSYDTSDADEAAAFTASMQDDPQLARDKELCATFTLTGKARGHRPQYPPSGRTTNLRAGECSRPGCSRVYDHDPEKLSVCKTWLFKGDCGDGDDCSLSHEASEHNTPHCQHFQKGRCSKDDCQFPHVRLNPGALNCEAFGQKGYCEKGSRCSELHAHECPTFANTGTCRYGNKCRLGHVLRASRMKKAARRPSDTPSPPSDNAMQGPDLTSKSPTGNGADSPEITRDPHLFSQQVDYVPFE